VWSSALPRDPANRVAARRSISTSAFPAWLRPGAGRRTPPAILR
jgi:hypothetical protein